MQAIALIWEKQKVNQEYWDETPQVFIENYVRCSRVCIPCNCVPSVVMAQGILESGWFSTDSLFGVKATKLQRSQGIGTSAPTKEVVNGIAVPTVAKFFEIPSIQNNFANLFDYVARMKPLSPHFIPADVNNYLSMLQQAPAYSTAADVFSLDGTLIGGYRFSVLATIHSNGLTAFDHA
jgi:hypothetical protein